MKVDDSMIGKKVLIRRTIFDAYLRKLHRIEQGGRG